MSDYVARFQIVRQRCAANQLEDATISRFFLEGLHESVMREVVAADPHTVDDAVACVLAAERVEQMVNRIRKKSVSFPGYLPIRAINIGGYPGISSYVPSPPSSASNWDPMAPRPPQPPPIPQIMAPVSHTVVPLPLPAPPSHIDF